MLNLLHAQHHYLSLDVSGPFNGDYLAIETISEEESSLLYPSSYTKIDKLIIEAAFDHVEDSLALQNITYSTMDKMLLEVALEDVDEVLDMQLPAIGFGVVELDKVAMESFYEEDISSSGTSVEYLYLDKVATESFYEEDLTNSATNIEYLYLDKVILETFYEEDIAA